MEANNNKTHERKKKQIEKKLHGKHATQKSKRQSDVPSILHSFVGDKMRKFIKSRFQCD